ncbi:DUF3231 family protein [Metabacillus bambusae]|uniref:DUF3231 family protein n=1 Tax=Metabacillus bambusae TaxID=2795218 RepID=A0ABS3N7A1_9BACI|nr:DUF3231 family protein [Metabacillus bambusae]
MFITVNALGICTISYFLKNVEDPDIRSVLEYGLDLAKKHIEVVTDIFKEEKVPLPIGLTDQEIKLNAPRLYRGKLNISGFSITPNKINLIISTYVRIHL